MGAPIPDVSRLSAPTLLRLADRLAVAVAAMRAEPNWYPTQHPALLEVRNELRRRGMLEAWEEEFERQHGPLVVTEQPSNAPQEEADSPDVENTFRREPPWIQIRSTL